MRMTFRLALFGAVVALVPSACFEPMGYEDRFGTSASSGGDGNGGGGGLDGSDCSEPAAICRPKPLACTGSLKACLSSDELLARYYIGPFDPPPSTLESDDGEPLSLTVIMANGFSFSGSGVQHGMTWAVPTSEGYAEAAVKETALMRLNNSLRATIEVVLEVEDLHPEGSRVLYIGQDPSGSANESETFTLILDKDPNDSNKALVRFVWHGTETMGEWSGYDMGMRHVLHLVLNTESAGGGNAASLYIDGASVSPTSVLSASEQKVALDENDLFVLGNQDGGARAFEGTLYYAAVYASALTAADVARNAALLAVRDDGP